MVVAQLQVTKLILKKGRDSNLDYIGLFAALCCFTQNYLNIILQQFINIRLKDGISISSKIIQFMFSPQLPSLKGSNPENLSIQQSYQIILNCVQEIMQSSEVKFCPVLTAFFSFTLLGFLFSMKRLPRVLEFCMGFQYKLWKSQNSQNFPIM